MPMEERMMARVGVPCRERRASTAGRKPRSAMPSSWKLSDAISACNKVKATCEPFCVNDPILPPSVTVKTLVILCRTTFCPANSLDTSEAAPQLQAAWRL